MTQTRRDFLIATSAIGLGAALPAPLRAASHDPALLTAGVARLPLVPGDYPETELWLYGGGTPGPEIRVAQGARVRRRLVNDLPQPTSLHWHGIRIDNAMDGVSGLTQAAVPPGGTFDYDFTVPDAGTYWFHAHHRSVEQVSRGLYGALIVQEPEPADVDREEVLVLGDWLLDPDTVQVDTDFGNLHALSHAGRWGNFITTNGQYEASFDVKRHERLRLRVINAATARIFDLALSGLDGWIMALDGMPLAVPERFEDSIALGPGQRVDLFVDVTAEPGQTADLGRLDRDSVFSLAAFRVVGTAAETARSAPPPLPPNPNMAVPGLDGARRISLKMEGGAMGGMSGAMLNGERLSMPQLAQAGMLWAFNGQIGAGEMQLAALQRGETVRLEIVNDTAFPHAMHLHGMHFREIGADGGLGPMRDTVLMPGGATREVAFVADNPGKWLFHCHMLSHAAAGMSAWIDVA